MKNLFTFCFCLGCCFLQAQSPLGFKHEIGLRLIAMPETWVTEVDYNYYAAVFLPKTEWSNGLTYQRFWRKFGVRAGLVVHVENDARRVLCCVPDTSFAKRQRFVPKIGAVYKVRLGRFKPYLAVDFFRTKQHTYFHEWLGEWNSRRDLVIQSHIINPIAGVDFLLARQFSIGMEMWWVVNRAKTTGLLESTGGFVPGTSYQHIDEGKWYFLFSPLAAIWGKFHF